MYMAVFGGFYFDTDYKLLKRIDSGILMKKCVLPKSRDGDGEFRLGNAVMGSEPDYPFWREFIDHIFMHGNVDNVNEWEVEAASGPIGLTKFFLMNQERYPDCWLAPRPVFHPELTLGKFSSKKDMSTLGIHLCWGSWRSKNALDHIRTIAQRKLTSF